MSLLPFIASVLCLGRPVAEGPSELHHLRWVPALIYCYMMPDMGPFVQFHEKFRRRKNTLVKGLDQ